MGTKLSRKVVGAAVAITISASVINPVAANAKEPPVAPGMVRIDVPGIVVPGLPPGKMDVPRIPATPQEWEALSAEVARALDEALRHLNWAIERQREALDEMNEHERALTEARNNTYETREAHGEDSDEYQKALEDFKKTRGNVEGAAEGGDPAAKRALTDKDSRALQERGSSAPVIQARNEVAEATPEDSKGSAAVDRNGYVVPESERDSEGAFDPVAPEEAPDPSAEARDPDDPKAPPREKQEHTGRGGGGTNNGEPSRRSGGSSDGGEKANSGGGGGSKTTTRTTTKTAKPEEDADDAEEPKEAPEEAKGEDEGKEQSDEEKAENIAARDAQGGDDAEAEPRPPSKGEIEQRWAIQRSDFDPNEAVGSDTDPAKGPEQVSWTDADEAKFQALGGQEVLDLFGNRGLMDSAALYKSKFNSLKVDPGDGKAVEAANPMNNPLVAKQLPGCTFRTGHNAKVKYMTEVAQEGKREVKAEERTSTVWFPELCDNEVNKKIVHSLNHVMNATLFTDKDKSIAQLANDEQFKREAIDMLNGEGGNPADSRRLFDTMLRNLPEAERDKVADQVLQMVKERGEAGGEYVPELANSLTEGARPAKEHLERLFADPENISIVEPRGTFSKKMTGEMKEGSQTIKGGLDAGPLKITSYEREGDAKQLFSSGLLGMTAAGVPLILTGENIAAIGPNPVKKADNKVVPDNVVAEPIRTKFDGDMLENESFKNYVLNMAAAAAVTNTFNQAVRDASNGPALFYKRPANEDANRHVGLDRNPAENQQAQKDFNDWRYLYKKAAWWGSLTNEERANRETGKAGLDQQAQKEQEVKAGELLNPNFSKANEHPVYGFGAYKAPVGVPYLLTEEEKGVYGDLAKVDALKFVQDLSKNNEKGAILDSIRLTEDPAVVAEKVELIRDDITRLADQMYSWDDNIRKEDPRSLLILNEPGKGFNLTEQRPAFDAWFVELVRWSGEISEKQVIEQGEIDPKDKDKDKGKESEKPEDKGKNDKSNPGDKNGGKPEEEGKSNEDKGNGGEDKGKDDNQQPGQPNRNRVDEEAIHAYFVKAEELLGRKESSDEQIKEWASVRLAQTGIPENPSSNDGVAYAASEARESAAGNDGPAVPMNMPTQENGGSFPFTSTEPSALYEAVRAFDQGVMKQADAKDAAGVIISDPKYGVTIDKKVLSNGWKPRQENGGYPITQVEGTPEAGAKVDKILRGVAEKLPDEPHQKIVVTVSEASFKDMPKEKVKDEVALLKRAAKEKWKGEEPEIVMVMNQGKSPVTNSKEYEAIVASADRGDEAVFREVVKGQDLLAHRLAFESTVKYILKETGTEGKQNSN